MQIESGALSLSMSENICPCHRVDGFRSVQADLKITLIAKLVRQFVESSLWTETLAIEFSTFEKQ